MKKNEQISAMLDGELDQASFQVLVDAVDQQYIDTWNTYSLVGDLLRSTDLHQFDDTRLLRKIAIQLEQEPTVLIPTLLREKSLSRLSSTVSPRVSQFIALKNVRRFAFSVAAIGLFSMGLHQVITPLDSEIQMVRTHPVSKVSDQELALWQEYFTAHQQNSARSGLAGMSSMARVEAEHPSFDNTERVILRSSSGHDWMNVWEAPVGDQQDQSIQFNYVTSRR